jgi:hypothetical protein
MPWFFFHVHIVDGEKEIDDVGAEFLSAEDAIKEAKRYAGESLSEAIMKGKSLRQAVEVIDESGAMVAHLDCTASIEIRKQ